MWRTESRTELERECVHLHQIIWTSHEKSCTLSQCFKIKSVAEWVDLNWITFLSTLEVLQALTSPLSLPSWIGFLFFLRRAASSQTHKQFRICQCYLSEWHTMTISVWFGMPRSQMFDIYVILYSFSKTTCKWRHSWWSASQSQMSSWRWAFCLWCSEHWMPAICPRG